MDDKDGALLAHLRNDARMSVSELARRLNLSRTATQARLTRLEREGTIRGYSVILAPGVSEKRITALVMIKAPPIKRRAVESALKAMPALRSLRSVSGSHDFVAEVEAETVDALDRVLDAIGDLEGGLETLSSVVLATKVSR
ncbi:Lrp/AsnC family transcriptional regulator [Rhodospirillum sp. A1_3_36]|uniref:Lrp/AsnC family transcriptional regulator n=1 Tax=Rhodospirillum sp. A1_3_36 TaxID=3391666 RepID=UPI0039A63D13